jgi:endo-1,4-beta-xylanase
MGMMDMKWGRFLCTFALLISFMGVASAEPTGERLRRLADAHNLLIGYASHTGFSQGQDADKYQNIARTEFNVLTPENQMKWRDIHPEWNRYNWEADEHVLFAESNNMKVHGHALVWHVNLPRWLSPIRKDQLERVMVDHIETVVGHYRGRVHIWDVVNEAISTTRRSVTYRKSKWYAAMKDSYITTAFQHAHQADPEAILLYNDYDIETLNRKSDFLYQAVQQWLGQGAPIHGIGFQMHTGANFWNFQSLAANMQRFADLGLDIYITELDVRTTRSQLQEQAEVYKGIVATCLAQPRCKAIQTWGVSDAHTWISRRRYPLLFDDSYQPKPAYYTVQEALAGQ